MNNLEIDVMLNASAGYNDLSGTAQMAWHIDEHTALEKIATKHGIDVKKYEPIGLSLGLYNKGFGLSMYLANKQKKIAGKSEVKSVLLLDLTLNEFRSYLRDMDIRLFKPHENHDELYQYTGEIDFGNL